MQIVKLDKSYKDDLRKIFRLVFEDSFDDDPFKFFVNHDQTWEYVYGIIEDDKLVATYISFDVEVKIRDEVFKAHYLDGLATLPPYRNQGFMRKFFTQDVQRCKVEQIPMILLDPFKHSYYRKFGFEMVMDSTKLSADWNLLSLDLKPTDYTVSMDFLKDNQQLQVDYHNLRCWFRDNSHYNEMKMPEPYEDSKFHDGQNIIAITYDQTKEARGYLLYQEKNRTLKVSAFRYADLSAFYALKKHILAYTDQVNKVIFTRVPPDFPVSLILDTHWRAGNYAELKSSSSRMMRILNPQRLVEELMVAYPLRPLILYIKDESLPELEGKYFISTIGEVSRDDSLKEDLIIRSTDLGQLLTGFKSAIELYLAGKLEIPGQAEIVFSIKKIPETIQILDQLFPKIVTFMAEEW